MGDDKHYNICSNVIFANLSGVRQSGCYQKHAQDVCGPKRNILEVLKDLVVYNTSMGRFAARRKNHQSGILWQ